VDKFGSFPTDSRPSKVDQNFDLWDETLHSTIGKSSCPDLHPQYKNSHHQEGGKQWARTFQQDRIQKQVNNECLEPLIDDLTSSVEGFTFHDQRPEVFCFSNLEITHLPSFYPFTPSNKTVPAKPNKLTDHEFVQLGIPSERQFGFLLQDSFLQEDEMLQLVQQIDARDWIHDKEKKRVQIYGYNYLSPGTPSAPIPDFFKSVLDKISSSSMGVYDQLIVSEFLPGIGVNQHVDRFFLG